MRRIICMLRRRHDYEVKRLTMGHRTELYVHVRCARCGRHARFTRRQWIGMLPSMVRTDQTA